MYKLLMVVVAVVVPVYFKIWFRGDVVVWCAVFGCCSVAVFVSTNPRCFTHHFNGTGTELGEVFHLPL
jgi:hypothetical protein